jgi:iron complex transport system ATP-binding protein
MLRLNEIKSGYGKRDVIKGLSLEIRDSEIVALIGLNGSGKSTLLKTILGLIKPHHGEIFFDDRLLREIPLKERARKLSLLESQTPLTFPMSLDELMNLGARNLPQEQRDSAIERALEAAEMQNFKTRNLLELSSGETRRALIAHTLCNNSRVTMLDEPFAHLDWRHQKNLAESLKNWNKEFSTTFVLAVHELEWAVQIADRVCALHEGRIIAFDTAERVFADAAVREVFAFEAAIDENPIDGSRRLTLGRPTR